MAAEDELLKMLDPAIRQRIEANYDSFAPLLALMRAWQEEVEEHVRLTEKRTVKQLMGELFPMGAWKFPAQTLIVPQLDGRRRDVGDELLFIDRATQTPWTPCGVGETRPTQLTGWSIEQHGWDQYALVCDIEMESRLPDARLLMPPTPPDDHLGQAQLAFVCGSEVIVAELAATSWAVQHPGGPFLPVEVSRYEGYLDFEKGLGAARLKQRQLEAWMPPFYPYSRKFLRFTSPATPSPETPGAFHPSAWEWLGGGEKTIRLAALVNAGVANYFRQRSEQKPLILNAIPVAQMRAMSDVHLENPDRVGDTAKKPFADVKNCFAASAREVRATTLGDKITHHPARLLVTLGEEAGGRSETQHADVLYERPTSAAGEFRIRLYHECYGENAATPIYLDRPQGMRYEAPFPPMGSMNAPIVNYEDTGARRSWYHTLLRAPQLTLGDVVEILAQIPTCRKYLDIDSERMFIQLDIENKPWVDRGPWDNYLWPCLVSESSLLESRATYLSRSKVAVIPVMRLVFQPDRTGLPSFLQEDIVNYAASVISQYFMVGWYRVAGKRLDS